MAAQPICLKVEAERSHVATVPTSEGKEMRLSFRHSVYGSQVEEQFRITQNGFQIMKLRYAEPRLLEFYGHEYGRLEEGWWVVEGARRKIVTLELRVSQDSLLRIYLNRKTLSLSEMVEPGGLVRLGVTSCKR
ncbi:MAG: DUF1850 domain-containing protein [Candidatus Binatia bacterium]